MERYLKRLSIDCVVNGPRCFRLVDELEHLIDDRCGRIALMQTKT